MIAEFSAILYNIGSVALLIVFVFYPIMAYVIQILFPKPTDQSKREGKMLAAKLVLIDLQVIESTNEARKRMGLQPISQQPIIDKFKGFGAWMGLKIKVKEGIRCAMNRLGQVKP